MMKTKKVRMLLFSSIVATVLSLSLLAGNTLHLQFVHLLLPSNVAAQSQLTLSPQSTSSPSSVSSLPDVFQKVENSVVQITSTKSNPNQIIIDNGVPSTGRGTALGSGFVYDNQGHIVTNYHVTNGATRADITFTDGNTYSANVVGKDPNSDIAVLQITSDFSEENEDCVARFSEDCVAVAAALPPSPYNDCNMWVNFEYELLPLIIEKESKTITNEPTNNNTNTTLNLKCFQFSFIFSYKSIA